MKPFTGHYISCSKNMLKLTYSKVELQKCSGGEPPDPRLKGRRGEGREEQPLKHTASSPQNLNRPLIGIYAISQHFVESESRCLWLESESEPQGVT